MQRLATRTQAKKEYTTSDFYKVLKGSQPKVSPIPIPRRKDRTQSLATLYPKEESKKSAALRRARTMMLLFVICVGVGRAITRWREF